MEYNNCTASRNGHKKGLLADGRCGIARFVRVRRIGKEAIGDSFEGKNGLNRPRSAIICVR